MQLKPTLLIGLLLGLIAVSGNAIARWYHVEVVAFEHLDTAAAAGEELVESSRLPNFSNATRLLNHSAPAGGSAAFRALGTESMRLAGIYRRLQQHSSYRPLLAAAWRQPSYGVAGAKRVLLSDKVFASADGAGDETTVLSVGDGEIFGTVAIKISRLMHIEADFFFNHNGLRLGLHETRKAKLREIHHFDHPKFGLIVQVSPYAVAAVPNSESVSEDEPVDTAGDASQ